MEFYKTIIFTSEEKSTYDLEEECNIVIKLLDYNNEPVRNKIVRVKIVSLIDETIIYKKFTCNSDGLVTFPYTSMVPHKLMVECNNTYLHITYDGWYHEEGGAYYDLYYSLGWVKIIFKGKPNVNGNWKKIDTITSNKLPIFRMVTQVNWGQNVLIGLGLNGKDIMVKDANGGSWAPVLNAEIIYPYTY